MEPRFSIVIVTWKAREVLLDCLSSLSAFPPGSSWEAIVVDNASNDGTVEAVASAAPWARLVKNNVNRGLAAGNNQGVATTSGEFVVLSNPDVVFKKGTFDAFEAAMERHPRAAMIFPRLLHADGSVQTCAGDLPGLWEALAGRVVSRHATAPLDATSGFWWDGWSHDDERQIGHGGESCYVVRRAAIAAIGPQDERFVLDWEGIDWCARAQGAGLELWFSPDAEVTHLGGVSIERARYRWVIQSNRGLYLYFSKRLRRWQRPGLAAVVVLRAALKLAVVTARIDVYQRAHRAGGQNP